MTTYIKLEDALKTVNGPWIRETKLELLNSLPSISPEEMIEEMIEEQDSYTINQATFDSQNNKKEVLKELLQKFNS